MNNAETAREIANGTMPGGGSYQSPDDLCAAITAALDAKDKERQECIDAMEAEFDTEAKCAGLRLIHETEPDTRGIGPPGTMVACRRFAAPEGHVLTDDGVVRVWALDQREAQTHGCCNDGQWYNVPVFFTYPSSPSTPKGAERGE